MEIEEYVRKAKELVQDSPIRAEISDLEKIREQLDILYEKCNYNLRLFFFLFRASGGVCSFGIFGLNEKSVPDEIKGIRELKRMLFFDCCLD